MMENIIYNDLTKLADLNFNNNDLSFWQDLLTNLENCLTMEHIEPSNGNSLENIDNIEEYLQNCKNQPTLYLTDDMVFKIVTICLMSISRLKSKESNEVQGVVAVTLAILSQLLQFIITRLQKTIMNMAVSDLEATLKVDTYSIKLENTQDSQVLSEHESNGNHVKIEQPTLNQDNNVPNSNETDELAVDKKSELLHNDISNESNSKKNSKKNEKSKNILSKFRRRKRRMRTSSDSDTSDVDQSILASSSDEINSDVSETEEDDALSEENDDALSDGGLSDNNTDDEVQIIGDATTKEKMNGHVSEASDKTEHCNEKNVDHLVNGEEYAVEQAVEQEYAVDLKTMSDKDSVTNSNSATTITTNADSTSTCDESNDRLHNQNTISHMAQLKKRDLKPDEILNMLIDKEILASIKVCCDWLQSNPDIVRICAKSSRTLLKRVAILLNLIDVDTDNLVQRNGDLAILSNAERLKLCVRTVPLPEDIDLKGLNLLENAHKPLDWQILHKHRMNKREEILLRVLKVIEFGHHLTSVQNSGVRYNQEERLFIVTDVSPANVASKTLSLDEKNFGAEHSRGKLMRHMGKLWLKAEVRALESQLSRLMSPYLVPDHEVLTKHTPALKRLVYTKKFVVIIPSIGK
jgi:protein SMG5